MLKNAKVLLSTAIAFAVVSVTPVCFSADRPLYCACVGVGDDVAISDFAEACDIYATVTLIYPRSTVRAPKLGERYDDGDPAALGILPCNVDINGTAGCQQTTASFYTPNEPIACLGSGLRKKKVTPK